MTLKCLHCGKRIWFPWQFSKISVVKPYIDPDKITEENYKYLERHVNYIVPLHLKCNPLHKILTEQDQNNNNKNKERRKENIIYSVVKDLIIRFASHLDRIGNHKK